MVFLSKRIRQNDLEELEGRGSGDHAASKLLFESQSGFHDEDAVERIAVSQNAQDPNRSLHIARKAPRRSPRHTLLTHCLAHGST